MRITTWGEYGLIVSLNLARRAGDGPVAARELAEQEKLPTTAEQILLRLRCRAVESVRARRGGYHLAGPQHAITVKDLMDASKHATFEVNCDLHPVNQHRCSADASCSIRPVWRMLEQRINELLSGFSLADLLHDESEVYQIAGVMAGN
jgi:Rrf2 family cysteine metabolism transcriptional repressor